jgi:ATP-dependent DNA helicase RecQ
MTQATNSGALYISERAGIPPYSTTFWRPDQSLQREDDAKRIRYRYPTADGGRSLTFVGFQEPPDVLPAGTLLRVSLAHWWLPPEIADGEYRCFVQLSGYFWPQAINSWPWAEAGWEAPIESPALQPAAVSLPSPSAQPDMATAQELLKSVFGYDEFRPLQAGVIHNILHKRDTLAIMPTGSGKSLCYQLPALLFDGLTVVVSPLISLMQDQVEQLRQLGVPAVFLNSTLAYHDYIQTTNRIRRAEVRLLYVAPETLLRPETLVLLAQCPVACLTIDEAHCISSWGHDFRPEYRRLMAVRQRLPQAVCVAVTATATPRVQQDIKDSLGIAAADEFVASFNRENLFLEVQAKTDGLAQTLAFLEAHRGHSGIIYCATRRQVDMLAAQLAAHGWAALPYHAGLDDATRRRHQDLFSRDEVAIIVATIAFGMGINKSNVRFVVHYDLPQSIENYYQEIGRAGRDGLRADCLLLFGYADIHTIRRLIQQQGLAQQHGASLRLQAMVDYAETRLCRRQPLLSYFGEVHTAGSCDLCDNCLAGDQEFTDVTIPAQKFLSCVKRTGEIFGVNYIVDVLRGSKGQRILAQGHDKLSTYGIGQEYSQKQWVHLARHFMQTGLLIQDIHGGLKLTAKAYAVFKGEKVMASIQARQRIRAGARAEALEYDTRLFEILRAKRKEVADAADVPPYVIFSDRSLVEMAAYFPQSPAAFGRLYGVGRAKLEKYAGTFVPVIRAYCEANHIAEKLKPDRTSPTSLPDSSVLPGVKSRTLEIGQAYNDGRSIPGLAADLGVKPRTVIEHLWQYAQAGHPLRPDGFKEISQLPAETQARVLAAFAELGPDYLRPIYEALAESVSYDELHVMRLYYVASTVATHLREGT